MPEYLSPLSKYVDLNTQRGMIAIVWVIRQANEISYADLYQEVFGQSAALQEESFKTNAINLQQVFGLHNVLMQLFKNKVVETTHAIPSNNLIDLFQPKTISENGEVIKIRLASHMSFIQHLFDISLTEIVLKGIPIKSHPIFGQPISGFEEKSTEVFMIMPFRDDLQVVYETAIKPAIEASQLTVRRGDEFFSDQRIMDEVWSAIYHAKLCIAECTHHNPNVFYELGVAHSLGRPTIMIAREGEEIPFDIRDRRIILYQSSEEGMKALYTSLLKTIETELNP